jgi:TolB-like protein/DNA-binding winged helix-turn-helix (wHTH) protein/Tfp pilus assembly protein PilF
MSSPLLDFPPFRLDPSNERLWRETLEIPLRPKTFAVLRYLVEHAEQLVTKEELLNAVWADTVVGEDALTGCIRDLRKVLGDEAKRPQYIETVHRRGFRFIGAVTQSQESGEGRQAEDGHTAKVEQTERETETDNPSLPNASLLSQPSVLGTQDFSSLDTAVSPPASRFRRGVVLAAVLLLIVIILTVQYLSRPTLSTQSPVLSPQEAPLRLPDKPSIIVLPFTNLSGDPGQEYFSDGITEDLITDLSRVSSLFIIARHSAFTYKGKAVKVQDVGREMGVRYVLEGSVQKADQRVRINAQLVDALTGDHLWAERYDRPFSDIFTLQDEIVQQIVTTLKLQLTLEEQGVVVRKHTNNLEAYDAFLRGMDYFWRYTKETNAQAQQLYEKALALDPQYAEAYAGLGATYWLEGAVQWSPGPQTLERASALAQRAVALDDALPFAHSVLSWAYIYQQRADQALVEGERAIALDPNNADSYAQQAEALTFAGRPEDALRMVAQAMRLNPRSPPWYLEEAGLAYWLTGRYAEALATLQELIGRNPNYFTAHLNLAVSYLFQWVSQQSPAGQTLEPALAAIQWALALSDSYSPNHRVLGGISLWQRQYDQALVEMERGVALAPDDAGSYAALAVVLSCMGRTEEALKAAAQALRLKPFIADSHLGDVGVAYAQAGHYEEARAPLQRYLSRYPNILPFHLMLAAVYSELGQEAEARAEAAEVLRINPQFSLEIHRQRMPIKDPAVLERHIAALRKAGLK